jgi:hypothetical protein
VEADSKQINRLAEISDYFIRTSGRKCGSLFDENFNVSDAQIPSDLYYYYYYYYS